jgi:predicted nucleic acid-binding protein
MTRIVVDSFGWLEYLEGTAKGERVRRILNEAEEAFTPTSVVAEVTSRTIRGGRDPAVAWQAMRGWTQIFPLDADAARAAGALHASYRKRVPHFPMGDAVVLAIARRLDPRIVTGDPHFRGMRGVEFLS